MQQLPLQRFQVENTNDFDIFIFDCSFRKSSHVRREGPHFLFIQASLLELNSGRQLRRYVDETIMNWCGPRPMIQQVFTNIFPRACAVKEQVPSPLKRTRTNPHTRAYLSCFTLTPSADLKLTHQTCGGITGRNSKCSIGRLFVLLRLFPLRNQCRLVHLKESSRDPRLDVVLSCGCQESAKCEQQSCQSSRLMDVYGIHQNCPCCFPRGSNFHAHAMCVIG